MDLKVTLPTVDFPIINLKKGSQELQSLTNLAIVHTIKGVSYYLFKDKNGLPVLYTKGTTSELKHPRVFINITQLPFYTNSNKVEFLFMVDIEGEDNFYTTRVFI